jgi:hypothetical protein
MSQSQPVRLPCTRVFATKGNAERPNLQAEPPSTRARRQLPLGCTTSTFAVQFPEWTLPLRERPKEEAKVRVAWRARDETSIQENVSMLAARLGDEAARVAGSQV